MNARNLFFALLLGLLFTACDDDSDNDLSYDVPVTYSFENVSYSGQTQRLNMLAEMKSYMASSRSNGGQELDLSILQAMFENNAEQAGWVGEYEASKQLKSKTFASEQPTFEQLFEDLAAASQSTESGSEGQAGLITSQDGNKTYLVGPNGLDHAQLIEKGLMGAVLFYQATGVYLEPSRMDVDNETVTPGEGTEMEHHWDEAFGYYGVPEDFPANTNGVIFWGDYSNDRDPVINCNEPLMEAFIRGRAAISNGDLQTRDEAIEDIKETWELISAATAIHYLNGTIEDFDDMSIRSHLLSEAAGFIYSLQFNPDAKVSLNEVYDLLTTIGGSSDLSEMNFYTVTIADLEAARSELAEVYNLADEVDEL